ncbi:ABC transporter permease [Rhizobium sp. NPDC090279]|uniref:ABC transporter permease n=1 Tax=Rhizobium sp. NPDC090279 TaxID=3364499 RepID=UPI00383A46F9
MTILEIPDNVATTAFDRTLIKRSLDKAGRRQKLLTVGLIAPLACFTFIFFIVPIVSFLFLSVANPEVRAGLPETATAIRDWDGMSTPTERIFGALLSDLQNADRRTDAIGAARRLNYDVSGFHGLITKTISALAESTAAADQPTAAPDGFSIFGTDKSETSPTSSSRPSTAKQRLIDADPRWGEMRYWTAIKRGIWPITPLYMLTALDLRLGDDGSIEGVSPDHRIYVTLIVRTFAVSGIVTFVSLLLGFPLAIFIHRQPTNRASFLMFLVLVPLWTSILVRTTAWLVLLQEQGLLNDLIVMLHLSDTRISLIHNRFGVYVAMVHICLPFMVLPLLSVMKSVPSVYIRAAASLGATPTRVFFKVYLPLVFPGIGAGVLLVFIMCLGFYVTPALVGGPRDQMLSYFIAMAVNKDLNWGLASALSIVLISILVATLLVFRRFALATFAR